MEKVTKLILIIRDIGLYILLGIYPLFIVVCFAAMIFLSLPFIRILLTNIS